MRYKFYREHKFVSAALNDVERLAAKTDFRSKDDILKLQAKFRTLATMLQGNATYEIDRLQALFKRQKSSLIEITKKDNALQDGDIEKLNSLLDRVLEASTEESLISLGDQFYISYRKFVSDTLSRLHQKQLTILPELQQLYTDDELKKIEARTYQAMSPNQMVGMVEVLFPHLNPADKKAILQDMKDAEPDKFQAALPSIRALMSPNDLSALP